MELHHSRGRNRVTCLDPDDLSFGLSSIAARSPETPTFTASPQVRSPRLVAHVWHTAPATNGRFPKGKTAAQAMPAARERRRRRPRFSFQYPKSQPPRRRRNPALPSRWSCWGVGTVSGAGEEGGVLVPHERFLRRLARDAGSRARIIKSACQWRSSLVTSNDAGPLPAVRLPRTPWQASPGRHHTHFSPHLLTTNNHTKQRRPVVRIADLAAA